MNRTMLGFSAAFAALLVIVVIAVQRRPQIGDQGPIRHAPVQVPTPTPVVQLPSPPPPAPPTPTVKPKEPAVDFWVDLGKLKDGRETTDENAYLQSVLDRTADYLGLEGAARGQFIETARQTAYSLKEVETEYAAQMKSKAGLQGPNDPPPEGLDRIIQWRTEKINAAADTIRRSLPSIKEKKRTEEFGMNLANWFDYLLKPRPQ